MLSRIRSCCRLRCVSLSLRVSEGRERGARCPERSSPLVPAPHAPSPAKGWGRVSMRAFRPTASSAAPPSGP
ncbi:hypothetical protein MBTS_01575 [Methylobacterium bullatum]|nr:hypothetical protein [Methylobacterium bullatum]